MKLMTQAEPVKKQSSLIMKLGAMATDAVESMKRLFFNKVLEVSTVSQIKQNAINFGKAIAKNIHQNNNKFNLKEIEKLVTA